MDEDVEFFDLYMTVEELGLPRQIIEQDVASGRLEVNRTFQIGTVCVHSEDFFTYLATRVVELPRDIQKVFWLAVKKMVQSPNKSRTLPPEDLAQLIVAIQREIDKCS